MNFPLELAEGRQVWRGVVADAVPWSVVDMGAFTTVPPPTSDAAGFQASWDQAIVRARQYWQPGGSIQQAEVLVGGTIMLQERLGLLAVLRGFGLAV